MLLDMEVLMKIGVSVFGVGNNTRALSVEKTLKKNVNNFTDVLKKNKCLLSRQPIAYYDLALRGPRTAS